MFLSTILPLEILFLRVIFQNIIVPLKCLKDRFVVMFKIVASSFYMYVYRYPCLASYLYSQDLADSLNLNCVSR